MIASNRTRRAPLKARQLANRAAARIRRRAPGPLAAHVMAQGLSHRDATSVAGTLRKVAAKLGILGTAGRAHAGRHMRSCLRYTRTQVAVIAANYKARKPAYKIVAARLALAA
ncbi:hypothetical protein ACFV6B_13120 [Streptomyces microflavus]|uniref:hypothetical protein n=1 Tax=Streptomyces microflavus TaxID=1919 RepID=UPI0036618BC7